MIEKILERLSAKENHHKDMANDKTGVLSAMDKCSHLHYAECFKEAKEIVQEVAKEYDWIPVEQRLPEDFTYVYATCISLIDDRKPWVTEGEYNSAIGWKGMAPMLELGKAKVIAWMPKEWPAPYRKGGE